MNRSSLSWGDGFWNCSSLGLGVFFLTLGGDCFLLLLSAFSQPVPGLGSTICWFDPWPFSEKATATNVLLRVAQGNGGAGGLIFSLWFGTQTPSDSPFSYYLNNSLIFIWAVPRDLCVDNEQPMAYGNLAFGSSLPSRASRCCYQADLEKGCIELMGQEGAGWYKRRGRSGSHADPEQLLSVPCLLTGCREAHAQDRNCSRSSTSSPWRRQ